MGTRRIAKWTVVYLLAIIATVGCINDKNKHGHDLPKFELGETVCILPEFKKAVVTFSERQKVGWIYEVAYFSDSCGREKLSVVQHELIDCGRIKAPEE